MQKLFMLRFAFQQKACTKFHTHDNAGIMSVFKPPSKRSVLGVRDVLSVSYIKTKPQLIKRAGFPFKFSYFS